MKTIKQIGYKLIVVLCVITTFCCFIASTPVQAGSKVKTNEFYYSGTTKGSYVVDKGFLEKIVDALAGILDFILGLATMGFRVVLVGWTELLEKCLTWFLEGATGTEDMKIEGVEPTGLVDPDDYVTMEAIVFNHVPLLNINIFNFELDKTHDATGKEIKTDDTQTSDETDTSGTTTTQDNAEDDKNLIVILKKAIASWYYTFRLIALMVMLVLLMYIGIKLALTSVAKDKALYKKMLTDWLVGMILVFSIHYIILIIIQFNEILVDQISKMKLTSYTDMEVYEYGSLDRAEKGVTDEEMEVTLYDEVRTRAYDAKLTVGTTGMIMYMILVYYAWKFTIIYIKRYFVVAVLVLMAPIVAVTYAYNKVRTGKATIFTKWLKEFFFIVILQSIHALMYIVFLESALKISLESIGGIVLAFIMMNFMTKAEGIFRKIFNIKGDLTNSAASGKLSDIKNFASNAALGMGASKAAVGLTKLSARVVTKPVRAAGTLAFGKAMEHKANKIAKADEEAKAKGNLTHKELDEIAAMDRNNKIKLGAFAIDYVNGRYQNKKELHDALSKLKSAIPMQNDNGEEMTDEEYLENIVQNQEQMIKDYQDETKTSTVLKNKWKEIMDPFQYVEKQADNGDTKGKYKRISTKREHENWGPVLKYLSKKTDGVSVVNKQYRNADYLLNLDKKQKEALKGQVQFIKDEIAGFAGILFGLPLIVAEPALGAACLAKGISSTSRVYGGQGRIRQRNLKGLSMSVDGKFYPVRYEGKSIETMANGAQAMARETVADIEEGRIEHDKEVVRRTKKHTRLYDRLKGTFRVAGTGVATTGVLHTVNQASLTPMAVGTVAGVAAGTVLTGHLLGNFGANAFTAFQDTVRESRRAAAKLQEEREKSADSILDFMADKYFEMEEAKQDATVNRHTKEFEDAYTKAMLVQMENIDQMDDARLIRESNFEIEEIPYTTKPDGTKKIAADVERKIIDTAIIEITQKSGIINIEECNLNEEGRMRQVKKSVTDILIQKGVISKGESAESIITDLDEQIQKQKAELDKTGPKAVEEKLRDDSIIELMKEKDITNPDLLQTEDIMARFAEKYNNTVEGVSEQTKKATDKMATEREKIESKDIPQQPRTSTTNLEDAKARVQSSIVARKASFADRAKQKLDENAKEKLIAELKKKKMLEIDTLVLTKQEELDDTKKSSKSTQDMVFGGEVSTSDGSQPVNNTDDIIKMLQLQTALHKDKERLTKVSAYIEQSGQAKEKVKAYKLETGLFDKDGSVKRDKYRDGSRRVSSSRGELSSSSNMSIEDILRQAKREKINI